ncbi:PAS domain-containing protein [Halorubrum vacuolatum]|uniref:PAS domain S-box-containing protein n=1 Tax=Halorubrum vacuolatum TaxID=63740 RepID=A0A238VPQ2_HALVU|nr:PAS domain-containing protein [Halorubrum vacuolatum]SNR36315.1 PAS domain S-box-containing protein [Halorubrum vacuolatum]
MQSPETVTDPTVVVRSDGTLGYANAAARALLDVDPNETLVGTSILSYVAAPYHAPLTDQLRRVTAGDATAIGLTIEIDPSGSDSAVDESASPEGDSAAGEHDRELIALQTPVEWEGEAGVQMLLFPTTTRLPTGLPARTMDASPIGISIADATREDEPLIYVNDGFCDLTGYDRKEVLGQNCRFLQGEDTDPETVAAIRQAIDDREPITTELRNYRKDGTMFWNRLSITPIEDESGSVTHFLGFQEDVSERKVYEREKELFTKQADSVDQAVFITDATGTIRYANPAFERLTGYTIDEAIGRTPRLLKSDQQDEAFYRELWETITAGEVWEAELTNRHKSGELYPVNQKIVPITNAEGTVTHFVAIEEDITDSQFIEQVLHVMDRVLRHNVRNSVTAIDGYAELLEGELEASEHRAAVQTIRQHATTLSKLSEEIRRIQDRFMKREAQPDLSVGEIKTFVHEWGTAHPEAVIELSTDAPADTLVQNGSLLQLAIDEALENAVVHTDRGTPRATVSITLGAEDTEVRIDIADDGPGIPDNEWDVIMKQAETPLSHGSGIGLWLIYWTVTALGGTMARAPNDPRGTVLTLRVPLGGTQHTDDWNTTS